MKCLNICVVCRFLKLHSLLVCRTLDRLDQTETGKASESPCWLFWWCCHSLGCPSSCCQKVEKQQHYHLLVVNIRSYSWIKAAQGGSIMAPPTAGFDWLLRCMLCLFLTDGGDRHSGSKLTLDDLFHRDFQIHDPDAKWISGEYTTNASSACFCYFCFTHFTKIRLCVCLFCEETFQKLKAMKLKLGWQTQWGQS